MKHYLSIRQIADRTGEDYNTVKSLAGRRLRDGVGSFPGPAAMTGEQGKRTSMYGWNAAEIDRWHEEYKQTKRPRGEGK